MEHYGLHFGCSHLNRWKRWHKECTSASALIGTLGARLPTHAQVCHVQRAAPDQHCVQGGLCSWESRSFRR